MMRTLATWLLLSVVAIADPGSVKISRGGLELLIRNAQSTIVYPAVGGVPSRWSLSAGKLILKAEVKAYTPPELVGKTLPVQGSWEAKALQGGQVTFVRVGNRVVHGTFRAKGMTGTFEVPLHEVALP